MRQFLENAVWDEDDPKPTRHLFGARSMPGIARDTARLQRRIEAVGQQIYDVAYDADKQGVTDHTISTYIAALDLLRRVWVALRDVRIEIEPGYYEQIIQEQSDEH